MQVVDGRGSYYEGALWALSFVEARRETKRRFGGEADAKWKAFRGGLSTSARIDLLLRDANAQWPGAFGARSAYNLPNVAIDEAFGQAWEPLDGIEAEELWRKVASASPPSSFADALRRVADAWKIKLAPCEVGPVGAADKLFVAGPSAIAAVIEAFGRGTDLDWSDQVTVLATPPAHRQLAACGAALVNATKATKLVSRDGAPSAIAVKARFVVSSDIDARDAEALDQLRKG